MPEGPTIVILKDNVQQFKGKTVLEATGNTHIIDTSALAGKEITDFKSWGKHFLICFDDFTIRVHFMLFGSYRINEHSERKPRLHFQFDNGELSFYACSLLLITRPVDEVYNWTEDIMNENYDEAAALRKLKAHPDMLVCDALLDQHIFAGSGNIVKNEVLFRTRIHPESVLGRIPDEKLKELISETVNYAFDFLKWKKEFTLKKHWEAYSKSICPRDKIPFNRQNIGKTHRRTFFCNICEVLF